MTGNFFWIGEFTSIQPHIMQKWEQSKKQETMGLKAQKYYWTGNDKSLSCFVIYQNKPT